MVQIYASLRPQELDLYLSVVGPFHKPHVRPCLDIFWSQSSLNDSSAPRPRMFGVSQSNAPVTGLAVIAVQHGFKSTGFSTESTRLPRSPDAARPCHFKFAQTNVWPRILGPECPT